MPFVPPRFLILSNPPRLSLYHTPDCSSHQVVVIALLLKPAVVAKKQTYSMPYSQPMPQMMMTPPPVVLTIRGTRENVVAFVLLYCMNSFSRKTYLLTHSSLCERADAADGYADAHAHAHAHDFYEAANSAGHGESPLISSMLCAHISDTVLAHFSLQSGALVHDTCLHCLLYYKSEDKNE